MPKKVDHNHKSIVEGLRACGASVQSIAGVGKGCPDLLVGYGGQRYGRNIVLEVKNPDQPPSKRRLTDDEKEWHANWRGPKFVVESLDEALRILRGK